MLNLAKRVFSRSPAHAVSCAASLCPLVACLLLALVPSRLDARAASADTCVTCHLQAGDERLVKPARDFAHDVHQGKGLTCASCHGGDATIATMDAMDPGKGFIGVPPHQKIPTVCGKCHSDADFMKRYSPGLRVDQLLEYRTSVHGKRLFASNDQKVAVCSSCHTAHAIFPAADGRSSVYPVRVASTCGHCHADAQYMAGYNIPTDQFSKYTTSIHSTTLDKVGDLSAPTCNTCHGNHGAVPPGATTVANVCGQCHSRQADNLQHSPHQPIFEKMGVPGCPTCHHEHDIHRATDQMLGAVEPGVCAACHDPADTGGKTAVAMRRLIGALQDADTRTSGILQRAERSGMEVSQPQFDLKDAANNLVEARLAVHTFNVANVRGPVEKGLIIARRTYDQGASALAELRFRRDGLFVSLAIILLVITGLVLKIRQVERRPGGGPTVHSIEE
jgi:hypothetical protein